MLNDLIEAHKATLAEFEAAVDRLEDAENAYDEWKKESRPKVKLYGIEADARDGSGFLRRHADDLLRDCRRPLSFIRAMSPDFAQKFNNFLNEAQASLYEKIDDMLTQEEFLQEAFGLTAVRTDYNSKEVAETEALNSICRYRCTNHDEERERLRYILECPSAMGCSGSFDAFAALILESVQ